MEQLTAPLLVVSPHLDDAVLSCGELLAQYPGSSVVTVFAGTPAAGEMLTQWDAACGFVSAAQAMQLRRDEDAAALRLVSAWPRRLDFLDGQYGPSPAVAEIRDALGAVVRALRPSTICFPAGLFHTDHALVHRAAMALRDQRGAGQRGGNTGPGERWVMYEDALYRRHPALLQRCLAHLHAAGIAVTPLAAPSDHSRASKRNAVACYASQLRGLLTVANGHADAFAPEGYWHLECAP